VTQQDTSNVDYGRRFERRALGHSNPMESPWISVMKRGDLWTGSVHFPDPERVSLVGPAYVRVKSGEWREVGRENGERASEALEQLMEFAADNADALERTEIAAKRSEYGMRLIP
jgi:hypothetical protein